MSQRPLFFIVSVSLVLVIGLAIATAQTREDWRATENQDVSPKVTLRQKYTGVMPGSGNNLPRVEELKGKPGTWVTWPGFFLMSDGTSRLFLQTTMPIEYSIDERSRRILLKLKNAKVHLRNNRNPLITVHMNTPLDRAYLKKNRKSLDLVMELRKSVMPSISQTVDSDGYHYLFVDFPPGNYPSSAPATRSFSGHGTKPQPEETAEPESEEQTTTQ